MEGFEDREEFGVSAMSMDGRSLKQLPSTDQSQRSSTTVPPSFFDYAGASYQSNMMTGDFLDSMLEIMREFCHQPSFDHLKGKG